MAMSGSSPHHSPNPAVSSPWSQIVAAAAEEPVAITESLDNGKRPAWNTPSNEGSSSELNPFMAAESWPALSESTRASAKSPSPSSSSSVPSSQGTGSVLHSPQRQVGDNVSTNDMVPAHRSYSNPSSNGGHPPQLSVPQGSMAATVSHSYNSSLREHQPRTGFVSNDHQYHRNSYRNRNGGPHQRGDGTHHHKYGSRRDQDRGNHEWNTNRNFNGRDNYMSPGFDPRLSGPPLPPNSAYIFQPPLMWPFSVPIGFHEQQPQMLYGGLPLPHPLLEARRGVVPIMPHPPPIPTPYSMPYPSLDPQLHSSLDPPLHSMIVNQIDYYFSDENLVKDVYLRRNMDDQGWVPINLIADFKKVKQLTDSVNIVLDAVRTSSTVEVQGDKIRRRNDWNKWILPLVRSPNVTGSQTIGRLADQVQNIALETINNYSAGGLDVSQNRPNGDLNSQFLHSSSEGTGQVHIQVSDHSISA